MAKILRIRAIITLFSCFILSGCLETIFAGTAGSVTELAKDRSVGDTVTDMKISTAIKAGFVKKNFRKLYAKIKIEVVQGRVLLTGSIEKKEDAITAIQIAWDQKGVIEVINELKVDKNSKKFDLVQYTRDTIITSQIKSKTFMHRDIKFINYTIITMNDVVYLFGLSRSEEELEKVANIASNVYGVKNVISHVKIQESAKKVKSYDKDKNIDNNESLDDDLEELNLEQGI